MNAVPGKLCMSRGNAQHHSTGSGCPGIGMAGVIVSAAPFRVQS